MKDCCKITEKGHKKCIRNSDKKVFNLPRRFSKKRCTRKKIRGFTMRSSCAPYNDCNKRDIKKGGGYSKKKKRDFLYNPDNPKKSFDVYIDKDPNDTIPIKYKTYEDVLKTIRKLERLYKNKKYTHKRIWQVGMIMKVRLEAMKKHKKTLYPNAKNVNKRFKLAEKYFKFLGERTKVKPDSERYKMVFKINN